MNNEPEDPTGVIILDSGMNKDECRAMCTSPQIPLLEKLFFRMIYETTTRAREVLESRIELWNRTTGEITFPKTKGKYNRWTRSHMPKTMKLTGNTSEMLRHYVGNRKKGHIFIKGRTGKRLTLRHFEKMIDKWARLLNIQKLQSIKPSGMEYHLITLMGLREAGERHHDPQWRLMCLRRLQGTVQMLRRRVSVRKGGRTAFQYEPPIEGCRSRFHRKGRKDRKDNVTLTLRPLRSLRCIIPCKLYFNSHGSNLTAHHFPTHALRMSSHTRSAVP